MKKGFIKNITSSQHQQFGQLQGSNQEHVFSTENFLTEAKRNDFMFVLKRLSQSVSFAFDRMRKTIINLAVLSVNLFLNFHFLKLKVGVT